MESNVFEDRSGSKERPKSLLPQPLAVLMLAQSLGEVVCYAGNFRI